MDLRFFSSLPRLSHRNSLDFIVVHLASSGVIALDIRLQWMHDYWPTWWAMLAAIPWAYTGSQLFLWNDEP